MDHFRKKQNEILDKLWEVVGKFQKQAEETGVLDINTEFCEMNKLRSALSNETDELRERVVPAQKKKGWFK